MNIEALKTIKRGKKKWSIAKCKKHVKSIIKGVDNLYPDGLSKGNYIVIPGFEHVTKNQPVLSYNATNSVWDLNINTTFKI
tara:strand:- start:222 stop:464 length:243 start_codon:yes stop_codon:yes gene_type:complete